MSQDQDHFDVDYGAATGAQAVIPLNKNHGVSFTVTAASDDLDIEVTYEKGGTRHVSLANVTDTVTKRIEGGVTGIALNITTNNSGSISIEGRTSA